MYGYRLAQCLEFFSKILDNNANNIITAFQIQDGDWMNETVSESFICVSLTDHLLQKVQRQKKLIQG